MEPRTVGHYRLIRSLGAGAAAEVFLAEDLNVGTRVALKLLHKHLVKNEEQIRRFEQEAEWISLLNHPNVLSVYEVGQIGTDHFMATEFVEGETLRHHVLSIMSMRQILSVSIGVAGALSAAHNEWIVHRDIKPENIMLTPRGQVKVLDFGFAKLTRPSLVPVRKLTRPGTVLGTLHYLSPEQILGWAIDPRTDLYSLGVVMFEMITGFPPFDAPKNRALLDQILRTEPPTIIHSRPDATPELDLIVQRCLKKDAEERYQSANELLEDLKQVQAMFGS